MQLRVVIIIHILIIFVPTLCKRDVKFSKMMCCEILNKEEFLCEFYADIFSDCPSDIFTNDSEDDSSSEYSSDSDDVNTRPTKKKRKTWDLPCDPVVRMPCFQCRDAGDTGSIPG